MSKPKQPGSHIAELWASHRQLQLQMANECNSFFRSLEPAETLLHLLELLQKPQIFISPQTILPNPEDLVVDDTPQVHFYTVTEILHHMLVLYNLHIELGENALALSFTDPELVKEAKEQDTYLQHASMRVEYLLQG